MDDNNVYFTSVASSRCESMSEDCANRQIVMEIPSAEGHSQPERMKAANELADHIRLVAGTNKLSLMPFRKRLAYEHELFRLTAVFQSMERTREREIYMINDAIYKLIYEPLTEESHTNFGINLARATDAELEMMDEMIRAGYGNVVLDIVCSAV